MAHSRELFQAIKHLLESVWPVHPARLSLLHHGRLHNGGAHAIVPDALLTQVLITLKSELLLYFSLNTILELDILCQITERN